MLRLSKLISNQLRDSEAKCSFSTCLTKINKLTRGPKPLAHYKADHFLTPPVGKLPGLPLPTVAQWMKRRGPALSNPKVQKLFRARHIRYSDPDTGLVHRAKRDRVLQPGSRLLVPHFVFGKSLAERAVQHAIARKRDPKLVAIWEDIKRRLLHTNEEFYVFDKPARMETQGAGKSGMSLAKLIKYGLKIQDSDDLKIVHRLDKDVSGALVIARSQDASAWLSLAFREPSQKAIDPGKKLTEGLYVRKRYWAVVENRKRLDVEGKIRTRLKDDKGQPVDSWAESTYKVLATNNRLTWLEMQPLTGKKHQLRIHCSEELESPIKGDVRYKASPNILLEKGVGPDKSKYLRTLRPKIYLHSRSVTIKRPEMPETTVTAPLPLHMKKLFAAQRWKVEGEVEEPQFEDLADLDSAEQVQQTSLPAEEELITANPGPGQQLPQADVLRANIYPRSQEYHSFKHKEHSSPTYIDSPRANIKAAHLEGAGSFAQSSGRHFHSSEQNSYGRPNKEESVASTKQPPISLSDSQQAWEEEHRQFEQRLQASSLKDIAASSINQYALRKMPQEGQRGMQSSPMLTRNASVMSSSTRVGSQRFQTSRLHEPVQTATAPGDEYRQGRGQSRLNREGAPLQKDIQGASNDGLAFKPPSRRIKIGTQRVARSGEIGQSDMQNSMEPEPKQVWQSDNWESKSVESGSIAFSPQDYRQDPRRLVNSHMPQQASESSHRQWRGGSSNRQTSAGAWDQRPDGGQTSSWQQGVTSARLADRGLAETQSHSRSGLHKEGVIPQRGSEQRHGNFRLEKSDPQNRPENFRSRTPFSPNSSTTSWKEDDSIFKKKKLVRGSAASTAFHERHGGRKKTDKEMLDELFSIDDDYDSSNDEVDYIAKMLAQQETEESKS